MDKRILVGILILGILFAGFFITRSTGAIVSAQGESVIEVIPDKTSVSITIDVKNKTAQSVQESIKQISDKTMLALLSIGIDEKDIELQNYNIYPDYEWTPQGGSREKGFRGNQMIIVKLSDFEKAPEVVDVAVNSGALISYINFELSQEKQNEYKAKALEEAGKDAKKKAESTAAGIGKKIGRLVSIESTEFNYAPWVYYQKSYDSAEAIDMVAAGSEAREAAISINPKTSEVRASVRVTYKIGF